VLYDEGSSRIISTSFYMHVHKQLRHKFRTQLRLVGRLTTMVNRFCDGDFQREEKICQAMLDPGKFNIFLEKIGRTEGEAKLFLESLSPPTAKPDDTIHERLPWWRLAIAKLFSL